MSNSSETEFTMCGLAKVKNSTSLEDLELDFPRCPIAEFYNYVAIAVKYWDHNLRDIYWSWAIYEVHYRMSYGIYLKLHEVCGHHYAYSGDALKDALSHCA